MIVCGGCQAAVGNKFSHFGVQSRWASRLLPRAPAWRRGRSVITAVRLRRAASPLTPLVHPSPRAAQAPQESKLSTGVGRPCESDATLHTITAKSLAWSASVPGVACPTLAMGTVVAA